MTLELTPGRSAGMVATSTTVSGSESKERNTVVEKVLRNRAAPLVDAPLDSLTIPNRALFD